MTPAPGRIVIVGAGPTGLGAAYRLEELGYTNYVLLERSKDPGGLAGSVVDDRGFTWDIGGHVQFSHYAYYSRVVDRALAGGWLTHERESWIYMRGRFIPYPFQHNLHRLDPDDCRRALAGLEAAAAARTETQPPARNFGEWIGRTFGEGIAELFMRPYNFKTWGYPPDELSIGWMGDRVAMPDLERIRANIAARRDEVSWGPNRTFRFPLHGGTGAIWGGVSALLPGARQRFGVDVVSIDGERRTLRTADGDILGFDHLLSTMPLDRLCELTVSLPEHVRAFARRLRHSSVHIIGVGLDGPRPETIAHKCWMYFPERASPYYRVTVFSNYSPHNVPADGYWSLMAEVSESLAKPVDQSTLVASVVEAMRRDGLLLQDSRVVSLWHRREEYGYPTPFLGRDECLAAIRPALEAQGIYGRGRFGAWKYEVSNQDHSFMQGVELVDSLIRGVPEVTIDRPDEANSGIFLKDVGPA